MRVGAFGKVKEEVGVNSIIRIGFVGRVCIYEGRPDNSDGKESACNTGDPGSIPGSGRPPGEGNGNPLQYSCLENPMDRGAWQATVHGGHKELETTVCVYTNI